MGRLAICAAVLISYSEARAAECTPPTPACHLENGKQLLNTDPKRAAEELLASYNLDERTDTLVLYASALERDKRYAQAVETWQRVVVYRESELDAAKDAARRASGSKVVAARAAVTKARKLTEQAAEAIIRLTPNIARVKVRFAGNQQQLVVTRGGAEVDASKDVIINAGRDELVFTSKSGNVARVVVEVAAGQWGRIDAPSPTTKPVVAKADPPKQPVAKPLPVAAPERAGRGTRPSASISIEQPKPTKLEQPQPDPEPPVDATKPTESPGPALETRFVEEPRSRTMSRVGLGLVGGAVIVGGIAGTLGYLANRDFDRAKDGGCSSDGQCPIGPAADLAERSNDRARLAQFTAIGSGALLATGVTLWIVGRGKTRRAATDVSMRVGPSSAALAWRF